MSYPSKGFYSQKVELFLTRANATAMILIRGEKILYRAGQLSPEGFQQLFEVLNRQWPVSSLQKNERYFVVSLSGRYHCVFAKRTPLLGHRLGLVFPLQTTLVHIRQEMADLLSLIHDIEGKQLDDDAGLEQSLQLKGQSTPSPDLSPGSKAGPDGWQLEFDAPGKNKDKPLPEQPIIEPGVKSDQIHGAVAHTSATDTPIQPDSNCGADPGEVDAAVTQSTAPRWEPLDALMPPESLTDAGDLKLADGLEREPDQRAPTQSKSWQSLDAKSDGEDLASILQGDFVIDLEETIVEEQLRVNPFALEEPINEAPHWEREVTKPVFSKGAHLTLADTVFDTTFYLVPRLNHHYLLGGLPYRLREWIPQLCELYGWQLDLLSVRPDYIKWTLGDFPECLTQEMLGILRRVTSEQIFKVFPTLQAGNPTQDFWAPGYLVDTQNRDFPTQVLIAHVSTGRSNGYQPDIKGL